MSIQHVANILKKLQKIIKSCEKKDLFLFPVVDYFSPDEVILFQHMRLRLAAADSHLARKRG